jgi:hypothetical protein
MCHCGHQLADATTFENLMQGTVDDDLDLAPSVG